MHLLRLRRPRVLLLTICTFALSFLILLNVMVNQLQNNDVGLNTGSLVFEKIQRDGYKVADLEFENYVAKGNRQPKAANDKILNEVSNDKTKSTKTKNISHGMKLNFKFQRDKETDNSLMEKKDPSNKHKDRDNDYSDDINKVVIEEEDDDDDDDYDNDDDDDQDELDNTQNKEKYKMHENKFKVPENSIFEPKDFVNLSKIIFTKPPLRYQEINKDDGLNSNILQLPNQFDGKYTNVKEVTNGIYWSEKVEKLVPKGLTVNEAAQYISSVQKQDVKHLHPPTWNKCGRPKNGFVILQDGKSMCARYRDPHTKLVLGELMSYYLSRLLGMDNIPAVVLSWINSTSSQWRAAGIHSLEWKDDKVVALIQWIPNMDSGKSLVKIPQMIYKSYKTGKPITVKSIRNSTLTQYEVLELLQWGSMIIFDYLTGNYDRVASMQDAAEKEKKPNIILENIRNLRRSTKTTKLWLIDNESGLLDAYDLLYNGGASGTRFIKFHKEMLQTMCVFQKSMADAILQLNKSSKPNKILEKYARSYERLLDKVPKDYTYSLFQKKFSQRLNEVQEWIKHCQSLSMR